MTGWLQPLQAALDAATRPVDVFVRDDDAGWDDARLFALLDLCERHGAPIDLAVIPNDVHADLARELRARRARTFGRVGVHQHGFAHTNHEREGRKCEFGPSRSEAQQRDDVARGQAILRDLFEDDLDPIFTPPWNRCTAETGTAIRAAGLSVLSRDVTAAPLDQPGLTEVAVQVDWFASRGGVRLTRTELGERLASCVPTGVPLGVMLHHAVMDDAELAGVDELLELVTGHPNVVMRTMAEVSGLAGQPTEDHS